MVCYLNWGRDASCCRNCRPSSGLFGRKHKFRTSDTYLGRWGERLPDSMAKVYRNHPASDALIHSLRERTVLRDYQTPLWPTNSVTRHGHTYQSEHDG